MSNGNVLELYNNVESNCDNDIEVVKDEYKIICLMSIAKALYMCYFESFNTSLLDKMEKDQIRHSDESATQWKQHATTILLQTLFPNTD